METKGSSGIKIPMGPVDWAVVFLYILGIVALGYIVGKKQRGRLDYYLAGRKMGPWPVALSMISTQISAISLIGAPAFVALRKGGGLFWLQYELAVPLAMVAIMFFLVPAYGEKGVVSIYAVLEENIGKNTRRTVSMLFLLSRGLGTGVALFATSVVASVCLGLPILHTIIITGTVTVIYTTMGGIKADIYSDIIQLFIFVAGVLFSLAFVAAYLAQNGVPLSFPDPSRVQVLKVGQWGFSRGETFGFWPMLLGGFFLYVSYYGCDQSQAQRLLTTPSMEVSQKALLLNGLLRFPITLLYLFFGLLLIPFIDSHPEFQRMLLGKPSNFLVPTFIISFFPVGLKGLMVSGIFAATMSSADSALNSLSAITWSEFIRDGKWGRKLKEMTVLRGLTVLWGVFALASAFLFMRASQTVIELVNKIGSAFYGPVLAAFAMAILLRGIKEAWSLVGLGAGILLNLFLWAFLSDRVSWMWWNLTGFALPLLMVFFLSLISGQSIRINRISLPRRSRRLALPLLLAFPLFLALAFLLEKLLH